MAKTAWPTGSELTTAMTGMGITIPAGTAAADLIDAAIASWESDTGYSPFLAEANASDDLLDPPHDFTLRLRQPKATLTVVKVDTEYGTGGTTLTEGEDYWLVKYGNAGPFRAIRFIERQTGLPQTIEITGKDGYGVNIPLDAWLAVMDKAMAQGIRLAAGGSGPVSEVTQGLVKVKYSSAPGTDTITALERNYDRAVARYKMVRLA